MTPDEAAQWMLAELQSKKYLDQDTVAGQLLKRDKSLVYMNDNGNPAVDKKVLAAFNKLAPTSDYVWSRSERQWRARQKYDVPGRRMQD